MQPVVSPLCLLSLAKKFSQHLSWPLRLVRVVGSGYWLREIEAQPEAALAWGDGTPWVCSCVLVLVGCGWQLEPCAKCLVIKGVALQRSAEFWFSGYRPLDRVWWHIPLIQHPGGWGRRISVNLWPARSIQQVPGQAGLHRETQFQHHPPQNINL